MARELPVKSAIAKRLVVIFSVHVHVVWKAAKPSFVKIENIARLGNRKTRENDDDKRMMMMGKNVKPMINVRK